MPENPNQTIRGRVRAALRERQEEEVAYAPRCDECKRPIGRYVQTRLTVLTTGKLETDADLELCTCQPVSLAPEEDDLARKRNLEGLGRGPQPQ